MPKKTKVEKLVQKLVLMTVRLPEDQVNRLKALATLRDETIQSTVTDAVVKYRARRGEAKALKVLRKIRKELT